MTKTSKPIQSRVDVYTRVTNRIIADLVQGVRPWMKPWSAEIAEERLPALPMRHNGQAYRGVNILLLWGESMDRGFARNIWMTFKQAQEYGGHVRKGEHGAQVVYADRYTKTDTDEAGEEQSHEIPFLKAYTVFNVEQIEGLPGHFMEPLEPRYEGRTLELIEEAEDFFSRP